MAFRVDYLLGALMDSADCRDFALGDTDVGAITRQPGSVHDSTIANYQVVHPFLLGLAGIEKRGAFALFCYLASITQPVPFLFQNRALSATKARLKLTGWCARDETPAVFAVVRPDKSAIVPPASKEATT
jgi:hypothetical protein